MEALQKNNWGIYLKNEPLTRVPIQDGASMYKVTEIESGELLKVIDNTKLNEED